MNTQSEYSNSAISLEESNILKGFAIACVVVCHIGNHFTRATTPLGGVGVFIFLFCSGLGLSVSYRNKAIICGGGDGFKRILEKTIYHSLDSICFH